MLQLKLFELFPLKPENLKMEAMFQIVRSSNKTFSEEI